MSNRTVIRLGVVLSAGSISLAGLSYAQTDTEADTSVQLNDEGTVIVSGISLPGQDVKSSAACAGESDHASKVVCAANEFLDMLTEEQRAEVLLPLTEENSTSWSNLPCGSNCRIGISLADLSETQQNAALAAVKVASGESERDGYDEITKIMMADDVLNAAQEADIASPMGGGMPPGGGDPPDGMGVPEGVGPPDGMGGPPGGVDGGLAYSSDAYFIAILGTPGTSETWQLQFGGHHLATLHTFSGGGEMSATPHFVGVEPKIWIENGETYAPLNDDRDAMVAMMAGLSEEELARAKLDATFSDVLLGPGKDGQFPETKQGLRVGDSSDEQKALVLAAIGKWVGDTASASAEEIMAGYAEDLDETYIAFSGSPSLDSHADYVRIDGPGVWIEFVCQNGVIFGDEIHYHTIWRDHHADYGAIYDF